MTRDFFSKDNFYSIKVDEKYSVEYIPPSEYGFSIPTIRVAKLGDGDTIDEKNFNAKIYMISLDRIDKKTVFVSSSQRRGYMTVKQPKKVEEAIIEILNLAYGDNDYKFAR